jgi:hypothetical protein
MLIVIQTGDIWTEDKSTQISWWKIVLKEVVAVNEILSTSPRKDRGQDPGEDLGRLGAPRTVRVVTTEVKPMQLKLVHFG